MLNGEQGVGPGDRFIARAIANATRPVVIAVNKMDVLDRARTAAALEAAAGLSLDGEIFPVSARTGAGVPELVEELVGLVPEGPFLYPPEERTDLSQRVRIAELIREQVLATTREELPHAVEVEVEEVEERDDGLLVVEARVWAETESQKGILIGAGGGMIKAVGTAARSEIEALTGRRVHLDLSVRVRRGWRWNSPRPHTWPEQGAVVPPPPSDLGWARVEPVRSVRWLIQRLLLMPFTEAMVHPQVEGREWVRELKRPAIFAANHSSHADTSLVLYSLTDAARDRTVVAAAADYWFKHPILGNIVSLFLNTFPFSRTGGAQGQLHSSSELLKSGWNLVLFPEGSRSPDGRVQEFKPGVGFLARETGTPVVPMHIQGAFQVMPRHQRLPVPGKVRVRIGKPMTPAAGEGTREFTARVETAVRSLSAEKRQPEIQGTWIERWRASKPRELRYGES